MREKLLPYGRQSLDEDDIQAVVEVLRSDWLTTGPKVGEFEEAVCGVGWRAACGQLQFGYGRLARRCFCCGTWSRAMKRSQRP